jgi:hypothetical protein
MNAINNIKSFNIRQLYYSYGTIYDSDKTKIIPIFINKNKLMYGRGHIRYD